ncbi:mitochondrial ribonuclease P catalytic subunit [Diabrotica virgifera virgifera]|uniref:Mitochondrial ribonuclease P catalytic subunit n=1 Tax=Diabrotica virgifera virgifera TaxID=50390 RepID=A0A6P7F2I9_DIAVI|nr:mitochondrial ribonuclease P catalytic subunit [Diabrotica virgifera virgifera]
MLPRYFNKLCIRNYSFKKTILVQQKQKSHNIVADIIEENKITNSQDWKKIRDTLLGIKNNTGHYSKNNIDAVILEYCIKKNKHELGTNYINFLKEENIKPNLGFIGKYFKFLYNINKDICHKEGKKCPKDQEEIVLKMYNDLRIEYPLLDSVSLENIIPALSLTSEWKKCVDLLKEIHFSATPTGEVYSSVAAAAFLNKQENLSWDLLREVIEFQKQIKSVAFLSYLTSLKKLKKRENILIKLKQMFVFLKENEIICDQVVAEEIGTYVKKLGLTGSLTYINQKGFCKNCQQQLQKFELSNEEFEDLKNKILNKVILGKDIFVKTNPLELDKFTAFVSNQDRFDVVLDGLNIAYSVGTKQPPSVFAALLAAVVSHFREQNKKVLVVGRQHMTRWPQQSWNYINENATVFLAQNISQDDPYLLYCAINSGKDTIIVTSDLMRGHRFRLETAKHRLLFNRWLTQRQYQLLKVVGSGKPIFKHPLPYSITTQENGHCWHIPFKKEVIKDNESSVGWLCIS